MTVVPSEFQHTTMSNASLFNPPSHSAPSVGVFRDLAFKDLDKITIKKKMIDAVFKRGLYSLKQRSDITFRLADKGGCIVILDRAAYVEEMNIILSDKDTYFPLGSNPNQKYKRELRVIIDEGFNKGIVNKKERFYLIHAFR